MNEKTATSLKTKIKTLNWLALCKISGLLKVSWVIGSYTAFFSGVNIFNPLVGAFNSTAYTVGFFGILTLIKLSATGALNAHVLAFIIPGLCASLYWNVSGPIIRFVLPASCMVLFLAHPTGLWAAPYTLFWLIPMAIYLIQKNQIATNPHTTLFLHAVASTFIAHAVGSVIWIYTVPMPASAWLALIPVVCLERFVFASGMAIAHCAISAAYKRLNLFSDQTCTQHA